MLHHIGAVLIIFILAYLQQVLQIAQRCEQTTVEDGFSIRREPMFTPDQSPPLNPEIIAHSDLLPLTTFAIIISLKNVHHKPAALLLAHQHRRLDLCCPVRAMQCDHC